MSINVPEDCDSNSAILDIAQNSALDHIKDCGPQILGQLVLTVFVDDSGKPSCSASTDGNIFTVMGATEMWLFNEKKVG